MASIVSSIVSVDHAESDGRRYIQFEHVDSFGRVRRGALRLVPADFTADPNADAARLQTLLDRSEQFRAVSAVEDGEDSLVASENFDFSSKEKIARRLIRHMMRTRDPYFALAMEPLVEWIKASFTAVQIQQFLGISAAELQRLNEKYDAVISAKAALQTADFQENWD